jgi:murein L,D-transpeptidase YcbB/YkuD
VEDPVALARFVLSGTAEGDDARIRAAMASGERSTLRLPQPVPVVITYVTAIARSDGLHFRPDVYGHDAALERRLARSVR